MTNLKQVADMRDSMIRDRDSLNRQIAAFDTLIKEMGGAVGNGVKAAKTGKRKSKSAPRLHYTLKALVAKNHGLTAAELVKKAQSISADWTDEDIKKTLKKYNKKQQYWIDVEGKYMTPGLLKAA
jgi:hypothetical protein